MRHYKTGLVIGLAGAVLAGDAIRHAVRAAEPGPEASEERKTWYGVYGSSGTAKRLWSTEEYRGYKPTRAGIFRESETGVWIPLSIPWQWSVRYELQYERLSGTVDLLEAQMPPDKRDGGPYVKPLDGRWQIAGLCVSRVVFFPDLPVRPSLHAGLGLSWLNRKILEDGTYYNFNLLGGGGVEVDIFRPWSLFADCRLEHYSNGGAMYLTDKAVIGMESISGVVGVRREF